MNGRQQGCRTGVLVAFLALVGVVSAALGETPFEGREEVLVVEVPLQVVGSPPQPLTEAELVLLDDGREHPITSFRRVELTPFTPPQQVPPAARRRFLLLFDLSFASPHGIARARDAARRFVLEQLHPTDLAGVALHSLERGTQLLVTFTPDRAQLARAIDTLGFRELLGAGAMRDPLGFVIDIAADLDESGGRGGAGPGNLEFNDSLIGQLSIAGERNVRANRRFEASRVTAWADSLGELAGHLGAVTGRKHVVLFSEGFDGELLLGRQPSPDDQESFVEQRRIETGQVWLVDNDRRYGDARLQGDVQRMVTSFLRADCTIEAVDVSGLTAEESRQDRVRSVGRDALYYVAHETGGELFEDASNLDRQLARLLDRTRVTYLLAFQPQKLRGAGRYHTIEVKGPKGVELSHRRGYFEPAAFVELDPLEKSLLAGDGIATAAPRQDVAVDVLGAAFRASENSAYVPVLIEVGGTSLLAGHTGDRLELELYAYASDERGRMRAYFSDGVVLDLDRGRELIAASGVKYYGHLDLPPGNYTLRVLARNGETGHTGVVVSPLLVPDWATSTPTLLPPFVFEPPGSWLMVREKTPEGASEVTYPFVAGGQPFVPAARPALTGDSANRLCVVAYGIDQGTLELAATLRSGDGQPVGGGRIELVGRSAAGDGGERLLVDYQPSAVPPGDYTLEIAVYGEDGAVVSSGLPVRLGATVAHGS